jgi:hypothetical protein
MRIAEKPFRNSVMGQESRYNPIFNSHYTHIEGYFEDYNVSSIQVKIYVYLCQQIIFSSLEDKFQVLTPRLIVGSSSSIINMRVVAHLPILKLFL